VAELYKVGPYVTSALLLGALKLRQSLAVQFSKIVLLARQVLPAIVYPLAQTEQDEALEPVQVEQAALQADLVTFEEV
jgi:hypothetical protein